MMAMDLVNAKTPVDKLKWAFKMWVSLETIFHGCHRDSWISPQL